MNPFNRFYDTEISVYEAEKNTYSEKGHKNFLGTLICDLQPYESDSESKIYGLDENRSYKIFCDTNDLLKNGRYVNFGAQWYMIVSTQNWSMGMTAVMRGVENVQ